MPHQAAFHFLPFAPRDVLRDVRRAYFPGINGSVRLTFVDGTTPLACIWHRPLWPACIRVHRALDQPDTPRLVFEHVFIHELLHIEVPPRRIGRRIEPHPPEFWEREAELSVDRERAIDWLYDNLGHCLDRRVDPEGIWVCPNVVSRPRRKRR